MLSSISASVNNVIIAATSSRSDSNASIPTDDSQGLTSERLSEGGGVVSEDEGTALLGLREAPVTYWSAANTLIRGAVPLSLSLVGMAIQGIGNGIVVRHLSHSEMAAVPLAMASISEVMSIVEGMLLSAGVFIGELSGSGTQAYPQIGEVVAQSWWIGVSLSLPAGMLLRNISYILNAFRISEEIVHAVQAYCSAFSYGIVPICWFTSDLLFAQSIKKPQIVLIGNTVRAGLSMLLSYPLALGAFGLPHLGIAGLGYGTSLSAWLSLIGLRFYYKFSGWYHPFKLFNLNPPKIKAILKFFRLGLPLGLKEGCDGANALILSLLVGKIGKEALMAEEVSFVPISALSTVLTGLVSQTGVEIATNVGKLKMAARDDYASIERLQQNVKRFGQTGIFIGSSVAFVACLLFTGFSKEISEIFIDTSHDISEETLQLAQTLLFINGVSLFIDTVKNISANNLLSLQDALFSSLLNVIAMFIALPAGAYLSLQENKGAEWLFMTQLLASFIITVPIVHRWIKKSKFNEDPNAAVNRLS